MRAFDAFLLLHDLDRTRFSVLKFSPTLFHWLCFFIEIELEFSVKVQPKNTPMRCLGPAFYYWKDGGGFAQWLKNHPNSNSDVIVFINFIKKCTLVTEDMRRSNLVTFVDDVRYEDVFGLSMNGIQADNIELLMVEKELLPFLKLKQTSEGAMGGNELNL